MNPIPLRHQRRVYAYACGRCGAVPSVGSFLGYDPAEKDKRIAQHAEDYLTKAKECCTCSDCGAELADETYGRCGPCEENDKVQRDARAANLVAREDARTLRNKEAIAAVGGDVDAAMRLRDFMSDLSENCSCASWLSECEVTLWSFSQEPGVDHRWDMSYVRSAHTKELRRLSDAARGWWRWDNDAGGPVFVPLDVWKASREAKS